MYRTIMGINQEMEKSLKDVEVPYWRLAVDRQTRTGINLAECCEHGLQLFPLLMEAVNTTTVG